MVKVIVKENGADVKDGFLGMGRRKNLQDGQDEEKLTGMQRMKRMVWGCGIADLIL